MLADTSPVSGHVYRHERQSGARWVAKWRDSGGQHKRVLGKAWAGKGRPSEGYFTKRLAQQALDEILADARRGTLIGRARTGVSFREAAEEWLCHGELERGLKRSTVIDYTSALNAHLLLVFGDLRLDQVTAPVIERWRARFLAQSHQPRTAAKLLAILSRDLRARAQDIRARSQPGGGGREAHAEILRRL